MMKETLGRSKAGRIRRLSTQVIVAVTLILLTSASLPARAATFALTVQTDRSSYSGNQPIEITGMVSPPPGANTAVFVKVENPNGAVVDISDDPVNGTSGSYSHITYTGGTSNWIVGAYTVSVTWSGNGTEASSATTFSYDGSTTTNAPEFGNSALMLVALVSAMTVAIISKAKHARWPNASEA
jgi:hypothetical protein